MNNQCNIDHLSLTSTFMHFSSSVVHSQMLAVVLSLASFFPQPSFRDQFLPRFLFLLTSLLIHKVHDLLREEVVAAIFSMAAVDFGFFYKNFIPQLLASCPLGEECSRFLGQGLTTTDVSHFSCIEGVVLFVDKHFALFAFQCQLDFKLEIG